MKDYRSRNFEKLMVPSRSQSTSSSQSDIHGKSSSSTSRMPSHHCTFEICSQHPSNAAAQHVVVSTT